MSLKIPKTFEKWFKLLIEKSLSRKLLVWSVGTHMAYNSLLDSEYWFILSLVFLGVQGAIDWRRNILPNDENNERTGATGS